MKRLVLLWLASLVVVALMTSAFTLAQAQQDGAVVSGDDLGFRLDGTDRSGNPTGALVIRVDDEWVEVRFSMTRNLIR